MYVFKRIRWAWNLKLDIFVFFKKKDITLVKNGECKFADRNCGWSALGPLDAGINVDMAEF